MGGKEIELNFIKLYKQNRAEGNIEGIIELINKLIAAGDIDEETAKKYLPTTNETTNNEKVI